VARAQLIRDLKDDLGVNDEGVGVILNLVDQVHGLRRVLTPQGARTRQTATTSECRSQCQVLEPAAQLNPRVPDTTAHIA
jgi:hypothetical protein